MKWYESPIIGAVASSGKFGLRFEDGSATFDTESFFDLTDASWIDSDPNYENCTLIARPIEGMTDEESESIWEELSGSKENSPFADELIHAIGVFEKESSIPFDWAMALIKRGFWIWSTDRVVFRKEQS